ARAAIPRHGDPEPPRDGRHLPASGGAARPLLLQGPRPLPLAGGPRVRARSHGGKRRGIARAHHGRGGDPLLAPFRPRRRGRAARQGLRHSRRARDASRERLRIRGDAASRPLRLEPSWPAVDRPRREDLRSPRRTIPRRLRGHPARGASRAQASHPSRLRGRGRGRVDRWDRRPHPRGDPRRDSRDMSEPLLDQDFIARLERLELVSRKIVSGKLKGERRSRRRGSSTEFADFRPYVPGYDLRFLDWNILGRLHRLFLRVVLEEEDLWLDILVDASESMRWGDPDKFTYARRVAAALGYIGLVQQDRV